jgi:hypothetical protein
MLSNLKSLFASKFEGENDSTKWIKLEVYLIKLYFYKDK